MSETIDRVRQLTFTNFVLVLARDSN
jgi:hypothetical protein